MFNYFGLFPVLNRRSLYFPVNFSIFFQFNLLRPYSNLLFSNMPDVYMLQLKLILTRIVLFFQCLVISNLTFYLYKIEWIFTNLISIRFGVFYYCTNWIKSLKNLFNFGGSPILVLSSTWRVNYTFLFGNYI